MKKKLLILSMLVGVYTFSNAQIKAAGSLATKQATIAATNSFDFARISKQVTDVLSPKLKSTDAQKPAVNSNVNEMLNKKKNILPTA